ncbi:MAG TPA: hypothetical protein VGJ57_01675 [Nitrospirales bacterium]|jgi:hypothetical protein
MNMIFGTVLIGILLSQSGCILAIPLILGAAYGNHTAICRQVKSDREHGIPILADNDRKCPKAAEEPEPIVSTKEETIPPAPVVSPLDK